MTNSSLLHYVQRSKLIECNLSAPIPHPFVLFGVSVMRDLESFAHLVYRVKLESYRWKRGAYSQPKYLSAFTMALSVKV